MSSFKKYRISDLTDGLVLDVPVLVQGWVRNKRESKNVIFFSLNDGSSIKNLQIEKITVWDSGGNGDGSSTSNFISNLFKSLPPLQDISEMAGFELPDYLGKMKEDAASSSPVIEPLDVEETENSTAAGEGTGEEEKA